MCSQLETLISKVIQAQTQKEEEDILSRKDVAQLLQISLYTLHAFVKHGQLKPLRIPGSSRVYFKRSDVIELLQSNTKKRS